MKLLKIGSRGSVLALWQAEFVCNQLAKQGEEAEVIVIKTSGDAFPEKTVGTLGLKGVFIKELEEALLKGQVDLAVHSMKDVPTEIPKRLTFPAICRREDARDCVVSRTRKNFEELAIGSRVGTSSLRRQAQLKRARPDLEYCDLRGNVDTRLRKVESGELDAVILAKAGLERLGKGDVITQVLSPDVCLPAVGQGALGIEARTNDHAVLAILNALDDQETRWAVEAERALLAVLQGGCFVPVGALGRIREGSLLLMARVLSPDGVESLEGQISGSPDASRELGEELGRKLLASGADRMLRALGRATTHG